MRFDFGIKLDLSRDLLGFYRMDVFEMVKNCWLYLENIGTLCGA